MAVNASLLALFCRATKRNIPFIIGPPRQNVSHAIPRNGCLFRSGMLGSARFSSSHDIVEDDRKSESSPEKVDSRPTTTTVPLAELLRKESSQQNEEETAGASKIKYQSELVRQKGFMKASYHHNENDHSVPSLKNDNELEQPPPFPRLEEAEQLQEVPKTIKRTHSNDPTMHTIQDLSKFYSLDSKFANALPLRGIARSEYTARSKALHENVVMVREPGLECLEVIDRGVGNDLVAPKIVLYGKDGCGKSLTLVHALNACYNKGWFIICPKKPNLWKFHFKEVALSTRRGGRVDLPEESVQFLSNIKQTNEHVFSDFGDQMRTHETYVWSKREETASNSTIQELVEFGIERPKHAADVVGVLLKEVRLYGQEWPTRTVLAIDGVNGFFGTTKLSAGPEEKALPPTAISLIHNLVKLMSTDWKNGITLLTVDTQHNHKDDRTCWQPRYLLKEAGFNALHPFVPMEVKDYNSEEMDNTLDYYIVRQWIQNKQYRNSESARKELIFLSGMNPLFLNEVVRAV